LGSPRTWKKPREPDAGAPQERSKRLRSTQRCGCKKKTHGRAVKQQLGAPYDCGQRHVRDTDCQATCRNTPPPCDTARVRRATEARPPRNRSVIPSFVRRSSVHTVQASSPINRAAGSPSDGGARYTHMCARVGDCTLFLNGCLADRDACLLLPGVPVIFCSSSPFRFRLAQR